MDLKVEGPGENNVHNNAFYAEETVLKSEMQAMRDCSPLTARHWIVRKFLRWFNTSRLFELNFMTINTLGNQ